MQVDVGIYVHDSVLHSITGVGLDVLARMSIS
jgi:hypothetical protein